MYWMISVPCKFISPNGAWKNSKINISEALRRFCGLWGSSPLQECRRASTILRTLYHFKANVTILDVMLDPVGFRRVNPLVFYKCSRRSRKAKQIMLFWFTVPFKMESANNEKYRQHAGTIHPVFPNVLPFHASAEGSSEYCGFVDLLGPLYRF